MTKYQTITVLPNLSLEDRFEGINGWVDCGIDKKSFPQSPTTSGNWEWELVDFNFKISSEDAKATLEVDGWIVARGEHLLAYNKTNPRDRRFGSLINIVALGSIFRLGFCNSSGRDSLVRGLDVYTFSRCVINLCDHCGFPRNTVYRNLGLRNWKNEWLPGRDRFLRVRKVQQTIA